LDTNFESKKIEGGYSKFFFAKHEKKILILSSDLPIKEAGISLSPDIFIGIQIVNWGNLQGIK